MTVDLETMTSGLPPAWVGFLRDWHRCLRSANHPATTRYNYLLAAVQLARFLTAQPHDNRAGACDTPVQVTRHDLEAFQAWMVETRSASTAKNKYKALQQFFRWLMVDEEEIDESPMVRLRQPRTATTLIPVISDADTTSSPVAQRHARPCFPWSPISIPTGVKASIAVGATDPLSPLPI